VLIGPTGGYLFGFVAAAFVVGKLIAYRKKPGFVWTIVSMMAGMVIIYSLGVFQLTLVAQFSLNKAVSIGVLPFLPGDAVKIVLAALIYLKTRDILKR
jgi:biotin transport system substrate-specific component